MPSAGHDVARACAALRHEILKHRTTVLPDVADALDRGDSEPWEVWHAEGPEVLARVETMLGGLEALGRRHGVRMDLRRSDPVLGPLYRALRRVIRARRPPRDLRALSEVINRASYAGIGAIVADCSVQTVGIPAIRAVYARVVEEPGLRGAEVPELVGSEAEGAVRVRMYAEDLDDILANLLRNALSAGARHVAVTVGQRVDEITGVAWVEVAVGDDAPGILTNAMIRGRSIGRGLGLAADLVQRHGGILRVAEAEGGKAVIVALPGVEFGRREAEWTA